MNCDEAFDALTDVDGRETDELQQHLNMCPRCRQMREVLEPALSLFDFEPAPEPGLLPNAASDESAESIRKQFLSVEAVQMARESAQRLAAVRRGEQSTGLKRQTAWLLLQVAAAAAAVAIVFSLFAPNVASPERNSANMNAIKSTANEVCTWKSRSDRTPADAKAVVMSCVACHFEK